VLQGRPPDWQDFVGIVTLLFINSTISFIEENNAGNAAAALMASLAPQTKARPCDPAFFFFFFFFFLLHCIYAFRRSDRNGGSIGGCMQVLRDGKWSEQDAAILVPGDIISIKLGDIIPADARLLEGDPLKIDQSALTGESLPVNKMPGDSIYSGSTCKQGEIEAVVIATGVHTFFGKAAHLVDSTNNVGHFQKVTHILLLLSDHTSSATLHVILTIVALWRTCRCSRRSETSASAPSQSGC